MNAVNDKANDVAQTLVTTKKTIPAWQLYDPSKPWEAWVPDPDRYDKVRIHAEARKNGFEIYDADSMAMGMGLRTTSSISKTSQFTYSGKLIEFDVDIKTSKYVGLQI